MPEGSHYFQRLRKEVGGRGLATKTNWGQNTANIDSQNCVPLLLSGIAERGLNLWHRKDLLAPAPSARQPLFETLLRSLQDTF